MLSRARKPSNHLFDCFLEIVQPKSWGNSSHLFSSSNSPVKKSSSAEPDDPWVLQTYPTNYIEKHDQQLDLKAVPSFVYPCIGLEVNTVQNFSFVMTDAEAKWTYGFCRIAPNSETALVILSGLPWHDTFYKILNFVAELLNNSSSNTGNSNDEDGVWRFLEACRSGLPSAGRLPDPGTPFHISWASKDGTRHSDFTSSVPDPFGLPSIPENRNLSEYYNAVGVDTMLAIFAAMLHERRIMITSKKLYRLTACVQAANSLIYPMSWQHLYIPILPKHLVDYLSAPMPYLVGVPLPLFKRARPEEYGDAVVVDVDTNTISTPFHDEMQLPSEVITNFKRSLRSHRDLLGDAVARAFLQAIVHLIGGYKDALTFREGQKRISFDESVFLTSRSAGVKPFLNNILELQIFRQFIEERLQMLNDGKGVTDEFEREAAIFAEKKSKGTLGSTRTSAGKAVHMGKRAGATIKREGADLARIVKNNSNVKEAVSKVKAGGKSAYKGVKSTIKSSGTHAPLKSRSNHGNTLAIEVNNEPHSAPASPTLGERRRPSASSAISGVGLTNKDGYSDFESYSVGSSGSSQSIKRFGSSTLTSSTSRPLTANFVRNNTDLGFSGPVLKYERFDPPPVNITNETNDTNVHQPFYNSNANGGNSEVRNARISLDSARPAPLDLDLMSDLEHIINRKTSPLESSSNHNASLSLSSNGHIKVAKTQQESFSDLILLNNGNNRHNADADRNEATEVIFDPLLQPTTDIYPTQSIASIDNNIRSSALPRPPSKSSIQHIARNHGMQQLESSQFQHQPLTRSVESNKNVDNNFHYENNPFSQNSNQSNIEANYGTSHKTVSRSSEKNKTHDVNSRQHYSRSSENLLEEYGLDFSKLSTAEVGRSVKETVPYNTSSPYPTVRQSQNHTQAIGNNMDIFADLDPLSKNSGDSNYKPVPPPRPSQPPSIGLAQNVSNSASNQILDLSHFDNFMVDSKKSSIDTTNRHESMFTGSVNAPQPPMVPPRSRRSSQITSKQNQSSWTTFE